MTLTLTMISKTILFYLLFYFLLFFIYYFIFKLFLFFLFFIFYSKRLLAKKPESENAVFAWHQDMAYWPKKSKKKNKKQKTK